MIEKEIEDKLHELAKYLQDSYNGYKECADSIKLDAGNMRNMFLSLAEKRKNMLQQLKKAYGTLEALSGENGTVLGKLHQVFVELKGLLTAGSVDAIVKEVKRGENTLIEKYKELLQMNFPEHLKELLRTQLRELEKDVGEVDLQSVGVK